MRGFASVVSVAMVSLLWPVSLVPLQMAHTAEAAGDNMIILWDGSSTLTGWTCISCMSGDDFFETFIRGDATYGGVGGSADHLHTTSATVNPTAAANSENKAATAIDGLAHAHAASVTVATSTNLPAYRQLKLMQHNTDGNPATIPAGAILIFDAAVPSGFTRYAAQDASYIYGQNVAATTGGANTHTMPVTGTADASTGGALFAVRGGGSQIAAATPAHTHTHSGASAADNHEPPYLGVILGKLDSATTTVASGTIAMWDSAPGTDWTVVSGGGGDFSQVFIKPAASYGTTGGAATHTHADFQVTTGGPTGTTNARSGAIGASDVHTHTVDMTAISSENHLPPYRNVIFAQNNGSAPPGNTLPTASSVSIDSGAGSITLTESTTKTVSCVGTVTDVDGFADIASVTADLYRTALGTSSSLSNDNHYRLSGDTECMPSSGSGSSETYTCDFLVQYYAQATDAGSAFAADDWSCTLTPTDTVSVGTNSSDVIEMASLAAISIISGDPIDYGTLDPNTDTGSTNQTIVVRNTGNQAIDPELSGSSMESGGDSIVVGQQEYAGNTFTYGAGVSLTVSPVGLNLTLPAPAIATVPVEDTMYWGIAIPNSTPIGSYTGTTTIAAGSSI